MGKREIKNNNRQPSKDSFLKLRLALLENRKNIVIVFYAARVLNAYNDANSTVNN